MVVLILVQGPAHITVGRPLYSIVGEFPDLIQRRFFILSKLKYIVETL